MTGKLYCDGASRGNPGDAGIGFILIFNGKKIEMSEYIGKTTNNVAEYTALIKGLEEAIKVGIKEIKIFLDSELIVRQLNGVYNVKNKNLILLYFNVKELLSKFKKYEIFHINREQNTFADKLAKEGSWKMSK